MLNQSFITITGIDERTDIDQLVQFSDKYCNELELGVLYSVEPQIHRYPRKQWILDNAKKLNNIALHICGKKARRELIDREIDDVISVFQRVQVNGTISVEDCELICSNYPDKTIITQFNESNVWQLFVKAKNHAILIDSSGGRGISPEKWTAIDTDKIIGYAGGIGTNNIAEELRKINKISNSKSFWVDMEGKVRVDNFFSLELVEQCVMKFLEYKNEK